jgi:predicted DNA-binding protein (MmcQ/YjbR family)
MKQPSLRRLRAICLALPEAEERETWGEATFRVRDKIFCMHVAGEDTPALWCKAPAGSQAILVGADAKRFFVPPYVGAKGWIGMKLDRGVDWREVGVLVNRSFRMTAPKKLAAVIDAPAAPSSTARREKPRRARP